MFKTNTKCRICSSEKLREFLDLTDQPPANSFIPKEDIGKETFYPLKVFFCEECNLAQLIHVVDKQELFAHYVYFSSVMPKLSDHFDRYAQDVENRFLSPGDLVVEIASNDGILLKHFKDRGFSVLGIDPAENIAPLAEAIGVPTTVAFFSEALAKTLRASHGSAKAILANNVVAHIDDHHDLARGVKALLHEDGAFVLEAPYLVDMFENLSYDTIYHEHLSFLALRPLIKLFSQFGLEVFNAEIHPVQGQSLRVFVGHVGKHTISTAVGKLAGRELSLGFDSFKSYEELSRRIHASRDQLRALLGGLKREGKRIAAYGAPAKGNTLLNFCGIGTETLDYAIDDLPSKQGLVTPGMHIPVISREAAGGQEPDYYLLLAWNYAKSILEKEASFVSKGGKFIYPIGNVSVL